MPNLRPASARRLLAVLAGSATLALATLPALADETPAEHTPTLIERASQGAQELALSALTMLGVDYRYGGSSPETGFDCSGMVRHVVRNVLGLDLPRTAREMAKLGERVPLNDLKPGDLVFFKTMRHAFSHVGIYLGDNRFVHAPSAGGQVRVDDMNSKYWVAHYQGARRLPSEAD